MENGDIDINADANACCCGWMGRNWIWCVPLVLLVMFVLCAGVAVWLFAKYVGQGELLEIYQADKTIQASKPFEMAMTQLAADPAVVERLGNGFEASGPASGSISTESENDESAGSANFYFDVVGPKGSAAVACQGKMIDGNWGLSTLKVTFDDGTRHTVEIASEDDGLEEAPAWSP